MFNLGMGEITVILLLALIFLGPSKLPELAAGLGKLIREIRKATSDVKNEIALDETFRKPFEDLRDAVTLHPDELKRRDEWRKLQEEAAKRAAEDLAAAEAAGGEAPPPPDGLASPVTTLGVSQPAVSELPGGAPLPPPAGPNDTVVQATPRGATLDDIPTPPPEPAAPKEPLFKMPSGAVPRTPAPPPPASGEGAGNVTQILKEEDLIPSVSSGKPPPPPHLPGLRPAGAPRPPGLVPPLPPNPLDTKKKPS
ncbi:MAG TPA: twin-arginine translocase TatA/TatE family subunit [Polyangia bacterium]|nr:twin-arginine translocase TatA/TatE family subunit [Polyangia bacterium]